MADPIQTYLDDVLGRVKEMFPYAVLIRLEALENSYIIRIHKDTMFGLTFATMGAEKIGTRDDIDQALHDLFPNDLIKLKDWRIILANYPEDMQRADQMANLIVTRFQMSTFSAFATMTADHLKGQNIIVNWQIDSARRVEDNLSPHGVRPRMDIGLTLDVKYGNDTSNSLGVIGGYTDFHEKIVVIRDGKRQWRYQPVFNITVLNTSIPHPGIAALLMATLVPTIINTNFWLSQWRSFSKGYPNPGNLENSVNYLDQGYHVESKDALIDFKDAFFLTPIIKYQMQDGKDSIPDFDACFIDGSMTHSQSIIDFFKGGDVQPASSLWFLKASDTMEGVYTDRITKALMDSRDIDYLSIVNRHGYGSIGDDIRKILLKVNTDPSEVIDATKKMVPSFASIWNTQSVYIDPRFIAWIIERTRELGLVITGQDLADYKVFPTRLQKGHTSPVYVVLKVEVPDTDDFDAAVTALNDMEFIVKPEEGNPLSVEVCDYYHKYT